MIEKMKKLSLIIYHNSREKFLGNLQNLGVVHLVSDRTIQNDDIIKIKSELSRLVKNEKLLNSIIKTVKNFGQKEYKQDINSLLDTIEEKNNKIESVQSEIDNINKEISSLEPWGSFDPDIIAKLENIGLRFFFYSCPASKFNKLDLKELRYSLISKMKGMAYFVIISDNEEEKIEIEANEVKINLNNIEMLTEKKKSLTIDLRKYQEELEEYIKYHEVIKKNIMIMEDRLDYIISNCSMSEELNGKVLVITGWVPKRKLKTVEAFLLKEDVVYILDDPKEGDNVPVLLKNDFFSRLFEPITKMHSLPGYFEIDPTPFFAPFFAVFFGLCLGDAGYGFVILLSVLTAFFLIKKRKIYPILLLGLILSVTTIAGGFVLNTFFGTYIDRIKFIPQSLKKGIIFGSINDQMSFALMLGVIQVILGLILQTVNKMRKNGITGGLQPIGTILLLAAGIMFYVGTMKNDFSIGPIPVKQIITAVPYFMTVVFILTGLGLLFVLLFNNIDKKIYIRPLTGLWEIYGLVTGVPGDILSYLRLFALGLAGGLLGNAFNKIAFMLRDGISVPVLNYLLMIMLMLLGHSINLALAALGAFVHPLRLVLLEFYKSVNYSGGGMAYSPLKNRMENNIKK